MLRNIVFILLFSVIIFGTYQASYPSQSGPGLIYNGFWLDNALKHVTKIANKPHPTGSNENIKVQRYLTSELSKLGGHVTTQKTSAYNHKIRKAAPVDNIIAVFPGKNAKDTKRKKLMLMSHYDSAKPFSKGAADAGSGVATILEGMRGFLRSNPVFENDIVVLLTDGEELGLLGAHAFTTQHHLAKTIGLVLNFEARGSSGPAIMWPESSSGTAGMVKMYQQANIEFPVTSSLIYEVYKMLPNDTDMTVFKQESGINGMNFAFIDNHFNYHTSNDSPEFLSSNSLMHQGTQLTALLPVVANNDLTKAYSHDDDIYFTLPFIGLFVWPAYVSWVILALSWFLFLLVIFKVNQSHAKSTSQFSSAKGNVDEGGIKKASLTWLFSSILSAGLVYLLLLVLNRWLSPHNADILQGFPYHGYGYLLSFLLVALVSVFLVYGNRHKSSSIKTAIPAAFMWLLIFSCLSLKLPGSSFLLLPVMASLSMMLMMLGNKKIGDSFAVVFATLGFLVISLLLTLLPVALGLKGAWISALLLTWCLAMFSPVIAPHNRHFSWLMLLVPLVLFGWINSKDNTSATMPLPTSLSYLYDVDDNQGWFYNYDVTQHDWNKSYFTNQTSNKATDGINNTFRVKHKQAFKNLQAAETTVPINAPIITAVIDKLNVNPSKQHIIYQGLERTSMVQIYSHKEITIEKMSINGRYTINGEPQVIPKGSRLIEYHMDGQKQLDMQITLADGGVFDWQVISHQFDLMYNPLFNIAERPDNQIPKPFVLTDNIVISQRFTVE